MGTQAAAVNSMKPPLKPSMPAGRIEPARLEKTTADKVTTLVPSAMPRNRATRLVRSTPSRCAAEGARPTSPIAAAPRTGIPTTKANAPIISSQLPGIRLVAQPDDNCSEHDCPHPACDKVERRASPLKRIKKPRDRLRQTGRKPRDHSVNEKPIDKAGQLGSPAHRQGDT